MKANSSLPCLALRGLHIQRTATFSLRISKLHLYSGNVLCVAGPNGSGKTTFIECLGGLLRPTTGAITINGHSPTADLYTKKATIGYIPDDEAWFVPELCATEYFALLENIYREAGVTSDMKTKVDTLCQKLYFTNKNARLGSLSHGNKKKVQIIAGLMHSPRVVIIDELRNGLDPLAINAAEAIIRQEAVSGACVIAATHDLWWAERVADQILLLIDGKPALHEATENIVKQYGHVEAAFMEKVAA